MHIKLVHVFLFDSFKHYFRMISYLIFTDKNRNWYSYISYGISFIFISGVFYSIFSIYDIYKDETIIDTTLLTAEHVVPKSILTKYNHAKKDMHNIFFFIILQV